jgi:hypothetical protein
MRSVSSCVSVEAQSPSVYQHFRALGAVVFCSSGGSHTCVSTCQMHAVSCMPDPRPKRSILAVFSRLVSSSLSSRTGTAAQARHCCTYACSFCMRKDVNTASACRSVSTKHLAPELCKFVNRREYRRKEGSEWRLCRAYGVKVQGMRRTAVVCERCVKLQCAATAAQVDIEAPGEYKIGQCTAHGQKGVKQHGVAQVQKKLTALGYDGVFLLEVQNWSMLEITDKIQGQAPDGKFKAAPDIRVDMLVTDANGQLLGIEVRNKESKTVKHLDADLRKSKRAPFPILWLGHAHKSSWDAMIKEAWCEGRVSLPQKLLDRKCVVDARANVDATCSASSPGAALPASE